VQLQQLLLFFTIEYTIAYFSELCPHVVSLNFALTHVVVTVVVVVAYSQACCCSKSCCCCCCCCCCCWCCCCSQSLQNAVGGGAEGQTLPAAVNATCSWPCTWAWSLWAGVGYCKLNLANSHNSVLISLTIALCYDCCCQQHVWIIKRKRDKEMHIRESFQIVNQVTKVRVV